MGQETWDRWRRWDKENEFHTEAHWQKVMKDSRRNSLERLRTKDTLRSEDIPVQKQVLPGSRRVSFPRLSTEGSLQKRASSTQHANSFVMRIADNERLKQLSWL